MTISDYSIVFAALAGPILAIQVQKFIERRQEKKNLKLWVFRQLMATRSARLSADHVQALNMIDVAFYEEKGVREAWKGLFDSFSRKATDQTEDKLLSAERSQMLVELLHVMAKSVDYDFDRTHIKNQAYTPQAHEDIDVEGNLIRRSLVKMLLDDGAFRLKVVELPGEDESQRRFRELLTEMYESGRPWPVRIVPEVPSPEPIPPAQS